MTTGNRVYDGRFPLKVPNLGTTTVGLYYAKTWSGGNSRAAKQPAPPKPVYERSRPPAKPVVKPNRLESLKDYRKRRREAKQRWRDEVKNWKNQRKQKPPKKTPKPRPPKQVMPPNAYDMTARKITYAAFQLKSTSAGTRPYDYLLTAQVKDFTHVPLRDVDHYAMIEKLRKKVYGSGWHPGVTAVEGKKALKMIGDSAKQLGGALRAFKGFMDGSLDTLRPVFRALGNPPDSRTAEKCERYSIQAREGYRSFSSAWLAFQYGWKPLVKDIDEGAAYIAKAIHDPGARHDRPIRTRKVFQGPNFIKYDTPASTELILHGRLTVHEVQYVITNTRADSPSKMPPLASLAAVAWETTPYSFVADWAIPISAYLQACRTAAQLKGTIVYSCKSTTRWFGLRMGSAFVKREAVGNLVPEYELVTLKRTVTDELNPPSPIGDLSADSVFGHWSRAVSAMALLSNLKLR